MQRTPTTRVRTPRGVHWCERGGVALSKPLPVWPLYRDENGVLVYAGHALPECER